MVARLSRQALSGLPAGVARPAYDPSKIDNGIVHLGIGNFHRAHQAVCVDDALNAGEKGWGIIGVSMRSDRMQQALSPQDGLYSLTLRDGDGDETRIIGAIRDLTVAPQSPQVLLAHLCNPQTRIVSLTMTEKGYCADIETGQLLTGRADVENDLKPGSIPCTGLGFLVEALQRRKKNGSAPFTVLSCDNLPANGRLTKNLLCRIAGERCKNLEPFIRDEVMCPSSMVDRIVPATGDADRRDVQDRLGVIDAWPVIAEPFFHWVIEDEFSLGRPQWERSGVVFVDDVAPYERMKLRLLNGAHTMLAAAGRTAGLQTVAEAARNPSMRKLLSGLWAEASATLGEVGDTSGYTNLLLRRFENPALRHETAQIATDASQKLPQRIVAPLRQLHLAGRQCPFLIFAIAAWIRSCTGRDESGRPMPVNDPFLAASPAGKLFAQTPHGDVVSSFLTLAPVFGSALPADEKFRVALTAHYERIVEIGIRAAADEID